MNLKQKWITIKIKKYQYNKLQKIQDNLAKNLKGNIGKKWHS